MRKDQLHPQTKRINSRQKHQSLQAKYAALNWLSSRFPKAFDTECHIQALKIGIMDDILKYAPEAEKDGISKAKLREAVVVFTRRLDYLACLKSPGFRINLEGEPVEVISEVDRQKAALKIKTSIEKSIKKQKESNNELIENINENRSYRMDRDPIVSKKIEIVFKNKTNKLVDPDAVERLKSKLGLGKKQEMAEN
jgi:ProP effector